MGDFAKSTITFTDETMTTSGVSTEIPLYVIATASNKLKDASADVALGTTSEMSNKLLTLTSQREVLDTFGVPFFVTENGTVKQGDVRNEYSLYALYDGMGVTDVAYAIRADIDLSQLEPTTVEPVGKPDKLKYWLDLNNTSFGLAVSNGGVIASRSWTNISDIIILKPEFVDVSGESIDVKYPVSAAGQYAMVVKDGSAMFFESFKDATWKLIGTDEWKEAKGSSISSGAVQELPAENNTCKVCGTQLTFTAESVLNIETVAALLGSVDGVEAAVENDKIVLSADAKIITLEDGEGTPLAKLGFELSEGKAVAESAEVFFSSSISYPSGRTGSIWFKTTSSNNGLNLVVKKYSESAVRWNIIATPVASSFSDIEKVIGATNLSSSSLGVSYVSPIGEYGIYKFSGAETTRITATATENTIPAGHIEIRQLGIDNTLRVASFDSDAPMAKEDFADEFSKAMLEQDMNGVSLVIEGDKAVLLSDMGTTITLTIDDAVENALGIVSGEYHHWELLNNLIASTAEPTTKPAEGTLWFNDDYVVDIMVTNGRKWVGYKNMYPNAKILVQSDEPEGVTDNTLWVNPSSASYPALKRYFDGDWEVVDTSDQTSPLGCVFAELRANSGYSYTGSSHEAYSTNLADLMISDYVDPDAVDPRSYPAGMICFNTRCSTNLVKKFSKKFEKAVEQYGETYQVGESAHFATPGTMLNPETDRWLCESGNASDGSGLFGRVAQRQVIIRALAEVVAGNDDLRNENYDIFYVNCAGFPELDDEIAKLNVDRKEMFYNVSDTPMGLKPNATDIQNWANNAGNAVSHGEEGRVVQTAYQTRFYPPMGITSNVDGLEVAIPSSIAKMRTLMSLPRGQIAAGYNYGNVTSLASVGYITGENEYAPVQVGSNGLGPVIAGLNMNPILARRGSGLMFWGENTEQSFTSSLSDEHCVITLLRLKRKLEEACTPFFYRMNNQSTRDDFHRALEVVLNVFVGTNEIYDYAINTDSSVNTKERIQRKELWADIAISFTSGVVDIYLPIRAVTYGSI